MSAHSTYWFQIFFYQAIWRGTLSWLSSVRLALTQNIYILPSQSLVAPYCAVVTTSSGGQNECLRDQIFKAIYLAIYWEKSFQMLVLFSWIILLDNAVVAELVKLYFLHNPEGNNPPSTSVSEPLRLWPFQTRSNTITLFIVKSVAGMATDLTLQLCPLTCFFLCCANFWSLTCFEHYI